MDNSLNSGLHRRHFISNHVDDIPMDTIRLVSPINRFAILQGHFSNDENDYPEKPYKFRTKLIISGLVILILISALSGYLIGKADYNAWKLAEPLDPISPLKPSPSLLQVFKRAAVCTDAPPCSEIGRCWNGDLAWVIPALVYPRRGGRMASNESQGAAGPKRHKTVVFGIPYKRPMSSSLRPLDGMMMNTLLGYTRVLTVIIANAYHYGQHRCAQIPKLQFVEMNPILLF
ncbi:jg5583 [Pararge aegeria aegeria]|uniref:Jg5583 protein n=1 Tax=Pararge aegeria aegeria TaxID=348720 RepID=A0A8S4QQ95_9NEOP|nr:jg5583 [Pararge aegeria aegeria]